LFKTPPVDLADAVAQSCGRDAPKVRLYYKKGAGPGQRIAMIADEGCGMDEKGLVAGPLSIGSAAKSSNPFQHGNYGMGGSVSFGQSEVSFIASRQRGAPGYHFTVVFRTEATTTQHANYVYLTHEDGSLFYAPDDPAFLRPGKNDRAAVDQNDAGRVIVPEHGTIRVMIGVKMEYRGGHASSAFTFLPDGLFGSLGCIQIIGFENVGHTNRRIGRRHMLDAVEVGKRLNETAEMLLKAGPEKIILGQRKGDGYGEVTIRAWVLSNWSSKDTTKPLKPWLTPVATMLDGDEKRPPDSLIVTFNGQRHGQIRTTIPFRHANISNLVMNLILEVALDKFTPAALDQAINPNRDRLRSDFEKALVEAVEKYLLANEEIQDLSRKMDSPAEKIDLARDQEIANSLVNNPIFSMIYTMKQQSNTTKPLVDAQPIAQPRQYVPRPPFKPNEPPTFICVRQHSMTGGTEYLKIWTDASEDYLSRIEIKLPGFLKKVGDGQLRMRNGVVTMSVYLPHLTTGRTGTVHASLLRRDGVRLTDVGTICVVSAKPPRPAKPSASPPREEPISEPVMPEIAFFPIAGHRDPAFPAHFGNLDESLPAFQIEFNRTTQRLSIYRNTQFAGEAVVRNTLSAKFRTDGPVLLRHFESSYRIALAHSAMIVSANELDKDGPVETSTLTCLAQVICAGLLSSYDNPEIRRAIVKASRETDA